MIEAPAAEEQWDWLTPQQAALYVRQGVRTLERWRAAGIGPNYHRLSPKKVRYTKADLDAYLRSTSQDGFQHAVSG